MQAIITALSSTYLVVQSQKGLFRIADAIGRRNTKFLIFSFILLRFIKYLTGKDEMEWPKIAVRNLMMLIRTLVRLIKPTTPADSQPSSSSTRTNESTNKMERDQPNLERITSNDENEPGSDDEDNESHNAEFLLSLATPVSILAGLAVSNTSYIKISNMNKMLLLRSVVTLGMVPILDEAIITQLPKKLEDFTLFSEDADVPAVIAILMGLLLGHVSAASVILLMITGGDALEELALERAGKSLHSLLQKNPPKYSQRLIQGKNGDNLDDLELVLTEELRINDIVFVRQNDIVPVDGILVSPKNWKKENENYQGVINESLFTGEMLHSIKYEGDSIMGGSVNHGNAIWIRVTSCYTDSVLSIMQAQLAASLEKKANVELRSKRIADAFTPLTLFVAALSLFFSKRNKRSSRSSWETVLSVFMAATPCPAAIGVPVAMLSGMNVANRKFGATIKSGDAFENLAACTCVVLDKTGTVTKGTPSVMRISRINSEGQSDIQDNIYRYILSVEEQSNHILARAICSYIRKLDSLKSNSLLLPVKDVEIVQGKGVVGKVIDKNEEYIIKVGTSVFCFEKTSELSKKDDESVQKCYFRIKSSKHDGKILCDGVIDLQDELREGAAEFIQSLKNDLGLRVVMLSGDASQNLPHVAKKLGINEYYCCLPNEKVDRIKKLQAQENELCLMVGDGANDSGALAAANVGMSLDPTNLSSESASIVLLRPDLQKIVHLLKLGRNVVRIAKRTVKIGMGISTLQMFLAATGKTSPFVNAVMQETIDLGTVVHALQALRLG